MHIPDGFLEPPVWMTTAVLAGGLLAYAVKRTSATLDDRHVPLLGVTGAFIFAAQMVNFPVGPGTSGHLVGGLLAASLLGPWGASVVLTVVLVIQCLIFQDGGLTALGANALNMAFIGTFCGYAVMRAANRVLGKGRPWAVGVALGAWSSIMSAALACSAELAFSGTVKWWVGLITIGGIHAVIGVGEAVITVSVIGFLRKTRPDLVLARTGARP